LPFWVYQVPREKILEVSRKLETLAKPNIRFTITTVEGPWTVITTGFSRSEYGRVFVEIEDLRYHGLATYELDKQTGRFEITDADFPYPLEFEILKQKLGINVDEFKLLRAG